MRGFAAAFEPGCERLNIGSLAAPPPWRSWATLLRASYQTQKLMPTSTRTTITPMRTASKPERPPLPLVLVALEVLLAALVLVCEVALDSALPRPKLAVGFDACETAEDVEAPAAVVELAAADVDVPAAVVEPAAAVVAEPAASAAGAPSPAVPPRASEDIVSTSANRRRMSTGAC